MAKFQIAPGEFDSIWFNNPSHKIKTLSSLVTPMNNLFLEWKGLYDKAPMETGKFMNDRLVVKLGGKQPTIVDFLSTIYFCKMLKDHVSGRDVNVRSILEGLQKLFWIQLEKKEEEEVQSMYIEWKNEIYATA